MKKFCTHPSLRLTVTGMLLVGMAIHSSHAAPDQTPFICQTEANGLGPPLDAHCSAKTLVRYYYKSKEPLPTSVLDKLKAIFEPDPTTVPPGFKPYDPSQPAPSDVAHTVTTEGQTVPFIVRRETGTLNRAVYDIHFLHQPGAPLPTPRTARPPGWNGRLVYTFGGGCGAGYRQGILMSVPHPDPLLALGYAVATSTLNVMANNCNDRLSAETLARVKEHFIGHFGEPVHVMGMGGSHGGAQQFLIAQNYPGLLDGIIAQGSGPEIWLPYFQSPTDCALLTHAFDTSTQPWSQEQKTAVSGFATWRTCQGWGGRQVPFLDPTRCDPSIPKEAIYERTANPKGVRCDIFSNAIHVFGRNPKTGLAYRPLDNVGVQYSLVAFNNGRISAEQFVELNEKVGGYDEDGHIVGVRSAADPEAIRLAYERGMVLRGQELSEVPIIDWRHYSDDMADPHDRIRSLVRRARLIAAGGTGETQAILVYPRVDFLTNLLNADPSEASYIQLVRQMDRWLDGIALDKAAGTQAQKVARNKPAELADGCVATDGERIVEPVTLDGSGRCNQLYPPHANPRMAAGGPLTDDVLTCTLKPLRRSDYRHSLSESQLKRLEAVFPNGVCDYSARRPTS